jgi:site-specific DNA-methyltransferase (adenine-specific)
MVIAPLIFTPQLYTDSSIALMLESVRFALEELENENPALAKAILRALIEHIASPQFCPPEPEKKARVKFPVEYPPQKTTQRILKGDCLYRLQSLEEESIDCVNMDSPYSQGQTSNGQRGNFTDLSMVRPFYEKLAQELARVMKPQAEGYCFIDWRGYALLYEAFSPYLEIRNLIVWDKLSGAGNHFGFSHELITFFTKKGHSPNKAGMNVWRQAGFGSGAKKTNGQKLINAQKPLELIQKMVEVGCPKYGTVLDPFTGSGTTAIVCRRTERNFIGFEANPDTYNIAVNRCREEAEKSAFFEM